MKEGSKGPGSRTKWRMCIEPMDELVPQLDLRSLNKDPNTKQHKHTVSLYVAFYSC